MAGLIDVETERARLEKRLLAASTDLALARRKLGNSSFKEKAPSEVVAKEEAKEAELSALVERIASQLTELGS